MSTTSTAGAAGKGVELFWAQRAAAGDFGGISGAFVLLFSFAHAPR